MLRGVVLAGGSSRRMGRPKATLDIDGVPLVVRVIGALRAAGLDQVHVIGGDPAELAAAGVTPHPDDDPGAGPLGGILSALVRFDGDLVVAACDLPDLDEPAVRAVVEAGTGDADVAVATSAGHHVLLLRVNRSAEPTLTAAYEAGARSVRGLLDVCRVVRVEIPAAAALDLDTPADVAARRARSR